MHDFRERLSGKPDVANIMWDVTNEYPLFRDECWVHRMGVFIKAGVAKTPPTVEPLNVADPR